MVKSVVREHHWAPDQIGALYFDAADYQGLVYWYNDVVEVSNEIKRKAEEAKSKNKK